jgi:predicted RNA-binding Zn-ribbon protein involved in translation (DUF1610 family)
MFHLTYFANRHLFEDMPPRATCGQDMVIMHRVHLPLLPRGLLVAVCSAHPSATAPSRCGCRACPSLTRSLSASSSPQLTRPLAMAACHHEWPGGAHVISALLLCVSSLLKPPSSVVCGAGSSMSLPLSPRAAPPCCHCGDAAVVRPSSCGQRATGYHRPHYGFL